MVALALLYSLCTQVIHNFHGSGQKESCGISRNAVNTKLRIGWIGNFHFKYLHSVASYLTYYKTICPSVCPSAWISPESFDLWWWNFVHMCKLQLIWRIFTGKNFLLKNAFKIQNLNFRARNLRYVSILCKGKQKKIFPNWVLGSSFDLIISKSTCLSLVIFLGISVTYPR
mgnify:CR=1 FL=1